MNFRNIAYLDWAHTQVGKVKVDLLSSSVTTLDPTELNFPWDTFQPTKMMQPDHTEIFAILSERYGVEPKNICLTTGVTAGLYLTYQLLLNRGETVLLETPNYEPLYQLAKQVPVEVRILDRPFEDKFQINLEQLERKISRNTRAIILTDYHNPSGAGIDSDKMTTLLQIAHDFGAMVLCDEVYKPPHATYSRFYNENMISMSGFAKIYGLAGIAFGWIVGPEDLIKRATVAIHQFTGACVSSLTEQVALHALKNSDRIMARSKKLVQANLDTLTSWLKGREHIEWVPPEGGTTTFLKLPQGVDSMALANHLCSKYGTLIAPGDFFWQKGFIRVSLGQDGGKFKSGLDFIDRAIEDIQKRKK